MHNNTKILTNAKITQILKCPKYYTIVRILNAQNAKKTKKLNKILQY